MGENGLMLNKKTVKNHVPPEQPNPLKINLPPSLFVTLPNIALHWAEINSK